MTHRATGIGSMPGIDFEESARIAAGEVGGFPFLAELPARGATAAMVGRTLALIPDLGFDLQPAGWRLTDAPGVDLRRAVSLLRSDLDTAEEVVAAGADAFKVQLAGPWTLAALVERPRGDKLLADHGARRELAQALAEGVREHCAEVARRFRPGVVVVHDEPALPAVLAGDVPTASGFSRHRAVTKPEAVQAPTDVAEAATASVVVHCCAAEPPFDVLRSVPLTAVSFDTRMLPTSRYDDVAAWLDAGREAWLGVVPSTDPPGPAPTDADLTRDVLRFWRDLGYGDPERIPATTVTPTCGLAGASPAWARTALGLCERTAHNLSEQNLSEGHGRIGP